MRTILLFQILCLLASLVCCRNLASSFTVVSYNVENLFDQKENPQHFYEAYQIATSSNGHQGNYGQKVIIDGKELSWTEVKIANIRKVLTDIDKDGPAVVALQEIENNQVLGQLTAALSDLGYIATASTHGHKPKFTIGNALISKFPIKSQEIINIAEKHYSLFAPSNKKFNKKLRPILKVVLDIEGHDLLIYNCHFKSKAPFLYQNEKIAGYAYFRVAAAKALEEDLQAMLAQNPYLDYLILGDLNENYDEKVSLDRSKHDHILSVSEVEHNKKLWSQTATEVLGASGNENRLFKLDDPLIKYNLHFELPPEDRKTAYHSNYHWSSLDHIIVGAGLYDKRGLAYIDQSFAIGGLTYKKLAYLLDENGLVKRWQYEKKDLDGDGKKDAYIHRYGGYSDHLPLFARFSINENEQKEVIDARGKVSVEDRPKREIMEAYDWEVILKKIADLRKTYAAEQVLCVFDIDNTLLAMQSALGSDQWWTWQRNLQRQSQAQQDLPPGMLTRSFNELLEIQYALARLTDMRPTDKRLSEIIEKLQKDGHPLFALTSRGPDIASATIRELKDQSLYLDKTAPQHEHYGSNQSLAYNSPNDLRKYYFVKRKPKLASKSRNVAYQKGVFFTSGMDKGIMLRLLLAGWKEARKVKAIVFVDDHHKHLCNMLWALQDLSAQVVVVHYRSEDKNVAAFNENKAKRKKTFDTLKALQPVCKKGDASLPSALISTFGKENINADNTRGLCEALDEIGFKNTLD